MHDAAYYRQKAEEAERQAETAPSAHVRETFQRIARGWRDLARQAEDEAPLGGRRN